VRIKRVVMMLMLVIATLAGATALSTSASTPAAPALPTPATILASMRAAVNYYAPTYAHRTVQPGNGWSWATYFEGVDALYLLTGDVTYRNELTTWGASYAWKAATGETNPDTVKALQTYYQLHASVPTVPLSAADAQMAADLTSLPATQYDWVDAEFMGLGNWARWAVRTGNAAYLNKMDAYFRYEENTAATSPRCKGAVVPQNGLWNATVGLWYRDCTFVGKTDSSGKPIYWARGNGWAFAAMVDVLQALPATSNRAGAYRTIIRHMAAELATVQGADGFWRASLLDAPLYPNGETSGTALITYALAWAIRAGIIPSSTYLPVVTKAWAALSTKALQRNGFLTDCQGANIAPGPNYTATQPRTPISGTSSGTVNADSPPFCVGAFVLAGSTVEKLA
jgi:rhamnogalacturonyl hydrolase YesR